MGWKGTVRSIGAAVRAAERNANRRQRELERQQKAYAKMAELERAAYEVDVYENHIERISSFHKECIKTIDWTRIVKAPPPSKPVRDNRYEQRAASALYAYKPGILDRSLGRADRKREGLNANIVQAKLLDDRHFQEEQKKYEQRYTDWKDSADFASRILSGDKEALGEAIQEFNTFQELSEIGSQVTLEINHPSIIEALILINGETVIPIEQKSLLQSGKLSVKKMPKGKYYELYQDAVCSAVLRVARDFCAMLPVKGAIVTAYDTMLNSSTGHLQKQPVLSVAIPRKTLEKINWEAIDPSDSMRNFIHRMEFKKTTGFVPVARLQLGDLKVGMP